MGAVNMFSNRPMNTGPGSICPLCGKKCKKGICPDHGMVYEAALAKDVRAQGVVYKKGTKVKPLMKLASGKYNVLLAPGITTIVTKGELVVEIFVPPQYRSKFDLKAARKRKEAMNEAACDYSGKLGLSMKQAYTDKRVKCPTCGRTWRVGRERGAGLLKYGVDPKTKAPFVRIPKHNALSSEGPGESFHEAEEWDSPQGRKKVVGKHPSGKLLIQIANQKFPQLLDPKELEKEIAFDTKAFAQRQKMQGDIAATKAKEDAKKAEKEDTDGFADKLPPMAKAKAIAALQKFVMSGGKGISRRDLIRAKVKAGAKIVNGKLENPDGSFISPTALGKIGMAYAAHLLKESLDEEVKLVRGFLTTGSVVFTLGQTGWFDLYYVHKLSGEERSMLTQRLGSDLVRWSGKVHDPKDKDVPEELLSSPGLLKIRDYKSTIQQAVGVLQKLGFPRQRETMIVTNLEGRVNPITGGGTGGYASPKEHGLVVGTSMMGDPDAIVHEWAHMYWFRMPKSSREYFQRWYDANVVSPVAKELERGIPLDVRRGICEQLSLMIGMSASRERWGMTFTQLFNTRLAAKDKTPEKVVNDYIQDKFSRGYLSLYGDLKKNLLPAPDSKIDAEYGTKYSQVFMIIDPDEPLRTAKVRVYSRVNQGYLNSIPKNQVDDYLALDLEWTERMNKGENFDAQREEAESAREPLTGKLSRMLDVAIFSAADEIKNKFAEYGVWPIDIFGGDALPKIIDAFVQRWNYQEKTGKKWDPEKALEQALSMHGNWKAKTEDPAHTVATTIGAPEGERLRKSAAARGLPASYAASNVRELWAVTVEYAAKQSVSKELKKALYNVLQGSVKESKSLVGAFVNESKGRLEGPYTKKVKDGWVVAVATPDEVEFYMGTNLKGIPWVGGMIDSATVFASEDAAKKWFSDTRKNAKRNKVLAQYMPGGRFYEALDESGPSYTNMYTHVVKGAQQVVDFGLHGRFHGYTAMPVEGADPKSILTLTEYAKGVKNGTVTKDPMIEDFDIPYYLKQCSKAMDDLNVPDHKISVVFASYPHGMKVSGWMYPAMIEGPIYLERKPSSTAKSKYAAYKGPRSPHTLLHEYAHVIWYQDFSQKERDALTAYYNANVKNNPKALENLISPSEYGTTKATEWWPEIAGYSMYPNRLNPEVMKFAKDLLAGKLKDIPVPSKSKTISTPAPAEPKLDAFSELVKGIITKADSEIKKAVGDYTVQYRPDGTVRIIPSKGQKDKTVLAKLAQVMDFVRHKKAALLSRISTGSQGGLVVYAEGVDIETELAAIAEEDEPFETDTRVYDDLR